MNIHPYPFVVSDSPATAKLLFWREHFLPTLIKIGPPRFRRWVVDHLPMKRLRVLRDVVDTLDRTTTEIFEGKKRTLKEGDEALLKRVDQAKDLLSILSELYHPCEWAVIHRFRSVKANMNASEEDKLPDDEVLGQACFTIPVLRQLSSDPFIDVVSCNRLFFHSTVINACTIERLRLRLPTQPQMPYRVPFISWQ